MIDLNQVLLANIVVYVRNNPREQLNENIMRHIVLNSIRSCVFQFKSNYKSVVIAMDSRKYWRKEYFPFYKQHRKKDREKSDLDWNLIWEHLNKIREELKQNLPYKVIEAEGAEADDVIAVLTKKYSQYEPILIISSDKDFVQLQKYNNVKQYNPSMQRFVSTENPELYIREHIIRGDRGDGIPNFLSGDNVFVVGERQKSINKDRLAIWLKDDPSNFCDDDIKRRGYARNRILVDFDYIPDALVNSIVETYDNTKPKPKMVLMEYLIEKGMKNLISVIDEF